MTHDADDMIADANCPARRRFNDTAERLVAQDQALLTRWSLTIKSGDDLAVGAAYTQRDGAHQQSAFGRRRLRHLV
jgi:hypothetical protein